VPTAAPTMAHRVAPTRFAPIAVAGELLSHGEWRRATNAGVGTWVGLLFGTLAKIALAFTMLGIFVLAFFL